MLCKFLRKTFWHFLDEKSAETFDRELRGSSRALRKKQFFAIRKIVFFGHCPCAGNELLQLLLVRNNNFSGSEKLFFAMPVAGNGVPG